MSGGERVAADTTNHGGRTRLRHRFAWSTTIGLALVWVLLWGTFSLGSAVFGLVVAVLVQALFPLPDVHELDHVRPLALLVLLVTTATGLIISSVVVSGKILAWWRPTQNALIRVPMRTDSQFMMSITAELTTLVPGSVAIEAEADSLLVHVFDASTPERIESARAEVRLTEARVIRAFGTAEERARLAAEEA